MLEMVKKATDDGCTNSKVRVELGKTPKDEEDIYGVK